VPISPFNEHRVLGRANEVSYDRLRFDVYPSLATSNSASQSGSSVLYEDDGITYNYLNNSDTEMNTFVETTFAWNYNSASMQFTASVISKGSYAGFNAANRSYGVRIYNVFSPKSVTCQGVPVEYNLLYFDEWSRENTYYFDGVEMALTVRELPANYKREPADKYCDLVCKGLEHGF